MCILLAAGVINAVLPADSAGATSETAQDPTAGLTASLVAPLPYAASQDGGITTIQDWGDVGPARQTDSYTYTAAPAQPAALPAFGRVDLDWFDDAAFLGDSLTVVLWITRSMWATRRSLATRARPPTKSPTAPPWPTARSRWTCCPAPGPPSCTC